MFLLVCLLLSTFQTLLVVVVYLLAGVFSVFNGSNREKYIYSIFLQEKACGLLRPPELIPSY